MRSKKAFKNTIWGLIYQGVVLICGLILPRLVLTSFGSDYNGITNTITQFLSVIALFQAGIGGVTMAALYKPLAENDKNQISVIVKTTEGYLRKVAFIFIGISVLIACFLPFIIKEFDFLFTSSLVIIMSFSTFAQYFFGQTYQFLLAADQRQRFMYIVNMVKVIINTVLSVVLIKAGFGIHGVKLGAAVIYIIAPIFVYFYVKKEYKLTSDVKPDNSVLSQRWDNFGMQVADFVNMNTDLIVISIFLSMKIASVYTVYNMVVVGILNLFIPFVNGVSAAFGDMLAKNEETLIKKNLRLYEQVVFGLSAFLFGVAAAMILSFVKLYTKNITDVNYIQPVFAYLLLTAIFFRAVRYPYVGIANAAGHFKQNRNLSFVEAGINVVLSVTLVTKFGIAGVAAGTLFAYTFRTVRYAMYVSANLIPRSNLIFIKRIIFSLAIIIVIAVLPHIFPITQPNNYLQWGIYAMGISFIAIILIMAVEFVFYRKDLNELVKMFISVLKKRKLKTM